MIALDIETEIAARGRGFETRRLTVATIIDLDTGHLRQYTPDTVYELVYQLPSLGTLIGFNIIAFDLPVLTAAARAPRPLTETCRTFDLYRDLVRRAGHRAIRLDDVALGTLGRALPQHGGDLAQLGQTRRLFERSANGTIEIAAIYNFGVNNRYVRWMRDGAQYEVAVDWLQQP
jgi:hypothetical protein